MRDLKLATDMCVRVGVIGKTLLVKIHTAAIHRSNHGQKYGKNTEKCTVEKKIGRCVRMSLKSEKNCTTGHEAELTTDRKYLYIIYKHNLGQRYTL